jgi:phosphoglycerate dehydrogenase-like enzyme
LVLNTSRAGLLDRAALFDWLRRDPNARAGIDVFESEPLPADDPWRASLPEFDPRLLLTPHLGYVTDATWRLFYQDTVDAIAAFAAGQPIRLLEGH